MTRIIHNRKDCNKCGICAAVCPEMFEMAEDQMADLKGARETNGTFELETDNTEKAKEAADLCAANVIKIVL